MKRRPAGFITLTNQNFSERVPFYEGENTIGRDSEKVSISVNDKSISGCHCKLICNEGEVWIVDLYSRNGVFIGDYEHRLEPGKQHRIGDAGNQVLILSELECKIQLCSDRDNSKGNQKQQQQQSKVIDEVSKAIDSRSNLNSTENPAKKESKQLDGFGSIDPQKQTNVDDNCNGDRRILWISDEESDQKENETAIQFQQGQKMDRRITKKNRLDGENIDEEKQSKDAQKGKEKNKRESLVNGQANKTKQSQNRDELSARVISKIQKSRSSSRAKKGNQGKQVKKVDGKKRKTSEDRRKSKKDRKSNHLDRQRHSTLDPKIVKEKKESIQQTKGKKYNRPIPKPNSRKRGPKVSLQRQRRHNSRNYPTKTIALTNFHPTFRLMSRIIIVEDIREEYQLLVVGQFRKSVKLLYSILKGKQIVCKDWLVQSEFAMRILPTETFFLKQNRQIILNSLRKVREGFTVFQGLKFYLGSEYQEYHLTYDNISLLILGGGGKIVTSPRVKNNLIIILPESPSDQDLDEAKKACNKVYTLYMVIEACFTQEINWKENQL